MDNMTDTATADMVRAEDFGRASFGRSAPQLCRASRKGQVLRAQGRLAEAIPECEMALGLNRNRVPALHALGQCKIFAGTIEETIPLVERAVQLNPRDHFIRILYQRSG